MEEIKKIEIGDKKYPELLREIENPPKILYLRGDFFPNKPCFAIVGTRRCSSYGKQVAFEISQDLAAAGLIIVSGMAPGIDTWVHKGALETKGITIAVLGTGVNEGSIYPQENLKLARKIVKEGGALISEYAPGTHGSKITFPQRNRIISGLSFGVLVVEAKKRSGALITAHWARKQKRKIFAIPGPVHALNSWGPNYLIKEGAKLVTSAEDILKELRLQKLKFKKKEIRGKSEEEELIIEALKEGPLYIDKIIEKTKFEAKKVIGILTTMEIKGKIKNLGGNIFGLVK